MDTVHLRVGKNGITEGLLEEIRSQLQRTDPLTIRLLPSFCEGNDRKAAAQDIASRTKSRVLKLTGGTLLLTRKR